MGFTERLGNYARGARDIAITAVKHPDILGFQEPVAASIDIAANCNLRCSHCYLYGKDYEQEEVEEQQFLEQVKTFREGNPSIIQCTWVGGEPLWRKELLREAVKFFPINWVVTNGTMPIDGKWYNTAFYISIDGTKEIHDTIRQPWRKSQSGQYSSYDRAKETAKSATAPVFVHTVINRMNAFSIPALVAEWKQDTSVGGFQFSLHTPQSEMTENDRQLFLVGNERQNVVDTLHQLKDEYGDYILMTHEQIDLLSPDNQLKVYGSNCPLPGAVVSVDSKFQRKSPCVMGPGMDCSKCGCVVPTMMHQFRNKDVKAFLLNAGTFVRSPKQTG